MNLMYSLLVGVFFGGGIYLLLRRSWLKIVLGLGLMGHAINLLVFASGGLVRGKAPLIEAPQNRLSDFGFADPLPQALVLTAIVIGFGAQVFLFVVAREAFLRTRKEDLTRLPEELG